MNPIIIIKLTMTVLRRSKCTDHVDCLCKMSAAVVTRHRLFNHFCTENIFFYTHLAYTVFNLKQMYISICIEQLWLDNIAHNIKSRILFLPVTLTHCKWKLHTNCMSFGLSTTEETWLVEMRIWCFKIGIVFVLHFRLSTL
jgi:hypothetical protein